MENLNSSEVIRSAHEGNESAFTEEQMRIVDHLVELRDQNYQKIRGSGIEAMKAFFTKTGEYVERLKSIYPDADEYLLFHTLTSSSCSHCTKFDFPGDDSVAKFIESFSV